MKTYTEDELRDFRFWHTFFHQVPDFVLEDQKIVQYIFEIPGQDEKYGFLVNFGQYELPATVTPHQFTLNLEKEMTVNTKLTLERSDEPARKIDVYLEIRKLICGELTGITEEKNQE